MFARPMLGALTALLMATAAQAGSGFPDLAPGATTDLTVEGFPVSTFRGDRPDEVKTVRKERVIGQANFKPIRDFPADSPVRKLSAMVGQLVLLQKDKDPFPYCTGFLVAHDLFLTNHHCVNVDDETRMPIENILVAMEHLQEGVFNGEGSYTGVARIVAEDAYLDYALLQLNLPLGRKYGWLQLERSAEAIKAATHVKIIQHPSGRAKRVVLEDTGVVAHMGKFLHYVADTEGGSSGSPVFDLNGERVIALHHVGTNAYNEGTMMDTVAAVLAKYLPESGPSAPVAAAGDSRPANGAAAAPAGGIPSGPITSGADTEPAGEGNFGSGGATINTSGAQPIPF